MSFIARCSVYITAILGVTAGACSASVPRPAALAGAPVECASTTLRSEADVSAYAACDAVIGDLRIQHSNLTDLKALARLRRVSGTLQISGNPKLDDLTGLEQLTSVGALEIGQNPELSSLEALRNLRSSPVVRIRDNAELRTLEGLEGIESAESISLERNGIFSTTGLANLREVGTLVVTHNSKLISLSGLKGLRRATSVEIRNNPVVAAYFGLLPQLEKVDQQLVLHSNSGLSTAEVRKVLERVERGAEHPSLEGREGRREASLH